MSCLLAYLSTFSDFSPANGLSQPAEYFIRFVDKHLPIADGFVRLFSSAVSSRIIPFH